MDISIDKFEEAKTYWLGNLSGQLEEVALLTDFPRSKHYHPASYKISCGKEDTQRLLRISKNTDLSLFVLLMVTLKIVLFKLTHQNEITTASPTYSQSDLEYNKFVVFRDFLDQEMTFKDVLLKVRETVREGYKYQFYPLHKIIDSLNFEDKLSPFKISLLLENIHKKEFINEIQENFKSDIIFSFRRIDEHLGSEIIYNSEFFTGDTIANLVGCYFRVLRQVLKNKDFKLADIELISEREKRKLLEDFNDTRVKYPENKTIYELFEEQMKKTPNQIAVSSPVDLSGVYDQFNWEKVNTDLFPKLEKCCFKMNPYIFQRDLKLSDNEVVFKLLKTHRHNSVVVNSNLWKLIMLFDGETNIKSIFPLVKNLSLEFLIYSVTADDVLEIVNRFSRKEEIFFSGNFEDFIRVVKAIYNENLIELTAFKSDTPPAAAIPPGYFNTHESLNDKVLLDNILSNKNKKVSEVHILILGDTPGLSTTGLLYLASYLRRNGFKAYCQFSDPSRDTAEMKQNIQNLLDTIQPRVVAVSMKWFLHMARVLEICKIVKEYSPDIKVVVGGNTASYYWEKVIRYETIDYIVRGDGEFPLLEICREADYILNCVYKKNGKVIENPITYLHDKMNSSEIYLSHLDEIMLSDIAPIFGIFFIHTQRGCLQNCLYCSGCNQAQKKTFNRSDLFVRHPREVRKDILEAKKYTSTIKFLFDDYSNESLLKYCKEIWEGIDLSSHFCFITNVIPPSPQLLEYVNKTFKYVYWNLDLCSMSERHRNQLYSLGVVKPQPSDEEILSAFDNIEKYDNTEVIINLVAGLPYFDAGDVRESEKVLTGIMNRYSCFSELFWARLHAQPGAPMVENTETYDMYSLATDFETFLENSRLNFEQNTTYPTVDDYYYPYIYFKDEELNSLISKHYSEMNIKIAQNREKKRNALNIYENISYQELNDRANQLAGVLRKKGVRSDTVVGIMAERSIEMIVGLLGILKAGAAYLPIDPEYPEGRIKYMLEDSNARLLLCQDHLKSRVKCEWEVEWIGLEKENFSQGEHTKPKKINRYGDLAYIIFTSGSTGKPKGVMVQHNSIVNTLLWRKNYYGFGPDDVVLQVPTFSFDSSVEDIFTAVISGARLILIRQQNLFDLSYLRKVISENHINHFLVVPGFYKTFLKEIPDVLKGFKSITVAGDSFTQELVIEHFNKLPGVKLYNEYGPTENSVCATVYEFDRDHTQVLIGRPINNVNCYILGKKGQLNAINAPGELFLSGAGLARAYMNRPELSAEKFIEQVAGAGGRCRWENNQKFLRGGPGGAVFSKSAPPGRRRQKIYKTGDLARWLADGNIQFLGRMDHQVKIRGFRIELGEIESRLLQMEEITETVAITKEEPNADKKLVAYIVSQQDIEVPRLKAHLLKDLPDYMVPSFFVRVDKIPLTPHGKVDRKALSSYESRLSSGVQYVAPTNKVEETIANIWMEVLQLDKVGIHDNFFDLGGDSMNIIQVNIKLKEAFDTDVRVVTMFRYTTIHSLAQYLNQQGVDTVSSEKEIEESIEIMKKSNLMLQGEEDE